MSKILSTKELHGEAHLSVAVVDTENLGPLGPRVRGGACVRGLGQELEVHHRTAAVPHGGADAVSPGVTALNQACLDVRVSWNSNNMRLNTR